tara:strand:+ start:716 stop:2077 length:1362 start_codon:yes stop_codon:yes gene_type:complete
MKRFKSYLNEDAFNIGLSSPDTNNADVNNLIRHLQVKSSSDLVMVGNKAGKVKVRREFEDDIKDIISYVSNKNLTIPWASSKIGDGSVGEGGEKISESTQEIMVAALVLNKHRGKSLSIEDAIEIINEAKKQFNKIQGASSNPKLLNQFDNNFDDLATAISSSNAILDIVPNPSKAYWTGQGWHKDIIKYNPKIGNVKDYNSSDIVIKGGNKYYGFSLKKKGTIKEADPTLINKPITGSKSFLKDIVGQSDVDALEKSKNLFFNYGLEKYYGKKYTRKQISIMKDKERNDLIRNVPTKVWSELLRDPRNVFFQRVEKIISENSQDFIVKFLNLLFRTDLEKYLESNEFSFYLLTGIGRKLKDEVVVEKAKVSELIRTIETLKEIYKSKLTVVKTKGKLQAWEPKAGASKIFLTIASNNRPIINIEIRYKGSYTANPQFQAVATPIFKNLFKKK